jgi:hypothetical protein
VVARPYAILAATLVSAAGCVPALDLDALTAGADASVEARDGRATEAGDGGADSASDAAPDGAGDAAPDGAGDAAPDGAGDAAPDGAGDAAPDGASEASASDGSADAPAADPCSDVTWPDAGFFCGRTTQFGFAPSKADSMTLYECFKNTSVWKERCPSGCYIGPTMMPDGCNPDPCRTVSAGHDGQYCGLSTQNGFDRANAYPSALYTCRSGATTGRIECGPVGCSVDACNK